MNKKMREALFERDTCPQDLKKGEMDKQFFKKKSFANCQAMKDQ